jgi:hypothetical protein
MENLVAIVWKGRWVYLREIKISPGIDPALIVAFMAIMDEMNEKNN